MAFFVCQNVTKTYLNSNFKLENISFEGESGDIIGLIGKNGAGKTTLLNALSNIIPRDEGNIYFQNQVVGEEFYRNTMGYLTDDFKLYDFLTIQENIDFVIRVRHLLISDEEVDDLLEEFNLLDARYKAINNLSKGMKQKFNFIITILHRPQILLLDEPFDGLDPQQIQKMEAIILKIASEGTCIVLSSHILDFINSLCNKVMYIKNGKLALFIDELDKIKKQNLEQLFYEKSN